MFLIEFSTRLMLCTAEEGSVTVKVNNNGTRSMISTNTKKLLVTFKSENQVTFQWIILKIKRKISVK